MRRNLNRLRIPLHADIDEVRAVPRDGLEQWEIDALDGMVALRDGVDYVNTDRRYERAYEKLTSAYDAYIRARPPPERNKVLLAKLCLWRGIALNENTDAEVRSRNDRAIAEYKRGLRLVAPPEEKEEVDIEVVRVRMSLDNSLGVAYHHRNGVSIPATSFRYYRKALQLFEDHPRDKYARAIMEQVERNSGGVVARPKKKTPGVVLAAGGGGGGSCNVV